MPVTDDIQAIADRANSELDSAHDFFEHSKVVWESFQILVDSGHTIVSPNQATGSTIDQGGLLALAPLYRRQYLATFTFRHFVSIFEMFLHNLLHRLLLHNPYQFAKCQLDFEVVLRASALDEVISGVILKQLNDVMHGNPREWFEALNKAVKLNSPSEDEIDAIAEIKVMRDILEHNAGIVNETYRRKAGKRARYAVGDPVEIDDNYHLESWRLLKKIVADISAGAISKLTGS